MPFAEILLSTDSANVRLYADYASVVMIISAAFGLALFIYWAVRNKFGRGALDGSALRSGSIPRYLPFAVIFGWMGLTWLGSSLAENFTAQMPDWQQKLVIYSVFAGIEIAVLIFILILAKRLFDGGLYGFGLRAKGVLGDIAAAAAMFVAVWPFVLAAVYLVMKIGELFWGTDFQMQQNEALAVIIENKQLSLRLLMIFFATILTPVFEELVFRGLVQSCLRNIGYSPWHTIFIASIIFSVLHPSMHFPALLILSVVMGYAYEKSGSLSQSIFIHIFFNASTIAFALLS